MDSFGYLQSLSRFNSRAELPLGTVRPAEYKRTKALRSIAPLFHSVFRGVNIPGLVAAVKMPIIPMAPFSPPVAASSSSDKNDCTLARSLAWLPASLEVLRSLVHSAMVTAIRYRRDVGESRWIFWGPHSKSSHITYI